MVSTLFAALVVNAVLLVTNIALFIIDRKHKLGRLQIQLHTTTSAWCVLDSVVLLCAVLVNAYTAERVFYQPLTVLSTYLPISYMRTFVQVSFGVNDKIRGIAPGYIPGMTQMYRCYMVATLTGVALSLLASEKVFQIAELVFWTFFLVCSWWMFALTIMTSSSLGRVIKASPYTPLSKLRRVKMHTRIIMTMIMFITIFSLYHIASIIWLLRGTQLSGALFTTSMAVTGTCGVVLTRGNSSKVLPATPSATPSQTPVKVAVRAVRASVRLGHVPAASNRIILAPLKAPGSPPTSTLEDDFGLGLGLYNARRISLRGSPIPTQNALQQVEEIDNLPPPTADPQQTPLSQTSPWTRFKARMAFQQVNRTQNNWRTLMALLEQNY